MMGVKLKITFRNKAIYFFFGFLVLTLILFILKYTWSGVISALFDIYAAAELRRSYETVDLSRVSEINQEALVNDIQTRMGSPVEVKVDLEESDINSKIPGNKGFTLIELLVVIAIIGLLASVVLLALDSARKKARDSQRKGNLSQISKVLELYYNDNLHYPCTDPAGDCSNVSGAVVRGECSSLGGYGLTGHNSWIPDLAPQYIGVLPHDPNTGRSNSLCVAQGVPDSCYAYWSDGKRYKAWALCTPETITQPSGDRSDSFYDSGAGGVRANNSWAVSTPDMVMY
jgi:prepilin-type N-terminal cleavage/methylation domain-containing protein